MSVILQIIGLWYFPLKFRHCFIVRIRKDSCKCLDQVLQHAYINCSMLDFLISTYLVPVPLDSSTLAINGFSYSCGGRNPTSTFTMANSDFCAGLSPAARSCTDTMRSNSRPSGNWPGPLTVVTIWPMVFPELLSSCVMISNFPSPPAGNSGGPFIKQKWHWRLRQMRQSTFALKNIGKHICSSKLAHRFC